MQSNTREQIEVLQQKLGAEASLIRLKTLAAWTYGERSSTKQSFSAACSVDGYCAAIFVDIGDKGPNVGTVLDRLEQAFNTLFFQEIPGSGFDRGWYSSLAYSQYGAKITVLVCPVGKLPQKQADAAK